VDYAVQPGFAPRIRRSSGWLCLLISLTSAGLEGGTAELEARRSPPAKRTLGFEADIKPILQASCIPCHSGSKPSGKLRLDRRDLALRGGTSRKPAIRPGNSDESPVILYATDEVEGLEMPPLRQRKRYPKLNPEQVSLLREWIDQGAPR